MESLCVPEAGQPYTGQKYMLRLGSQVEFGRVTFRAVTVLL